MEISWDIVGMCVWINMHFYSFLFVYLFWVYLFNMCVCVSLGCAWGGPTKLSFPKWALTQWDCRNLQKNRDMIYIYMHGSCTCTSNRRWRPVKDWQKVWQCDTARSFLFPLAVRAKLLIAPISHVDRGEVTSGHTFIYIYMVTPPPGPTLSFFWLCLQLKKQLYIVLSSCVWFIYYHFFGCLVP